MSEKKDFISKKGLLLIGIAALGILVIGLILLALGYNEAFHSDNSTVQAIFGAITFTGEAIFLVLLVAVFFIAYDKKFAKNLAFSLLLSVYVNEFIKEIGKDPRPKTNMDSSAEWGFKEPGYGFPSGHSQNAVATWGYIGYHFKDKAKPLVIPIIFSAWIFLIAISRIILGMHDLQDIVGGLLIGIGFVLAYIYLEPIISPKLENLGLILKLILAIAISMGLFILGAILFPTAGLGLVKDAPMYADAGGYAQASGALLGLSTGYLLEQEYVDYQPSNLDTKWKLINLIIGIVILLVMYLGLDMILEGTVILRFIRYAIVSFVLVFLVPILFKKINPK